MRPRICATPDLRIFALLEQGELRPRQCMGARRAFAEAVRKLDPAPYRVTAPAGALSRPGKWFISPTFRPIAELTAIRRWPSLAGARTTLGVPMFRDGQIIGAISFTVRKCAHSPTSRSSWSRTSPPRPSSPSRTRACSMSCANPAAADRDRRRAQGHQPLDLRSANRARHAGRSQRHGCARRTWLPLIAQGTLLISESHLRSAAPN